MSKTASKSHATQKGTQFSCRAPAAGIVCVAGTFNDWDPLATRLTRRADGTWAVDLNLRPGRYEYKFVVDGEWCCEPGCEVSRHGCPKCVANPFGTMNRVVEVA